MKKYLQLIGLITVTALLSASTVFAQDNEPALPEKTTAEKTTAGETTAEEKAENTKDVPASQEVEITEDNCRGTGREH